MKKMAFCLSTLSTLLIFQSSIFADDPSACPPISYPYPCAEMPGGYPSISINNAEPYRGEPLEFTANAQCGVPPLVYYWTIEGRVIPVRDSCKLPYTFTASGEYPVELRIVDKNNADSGQAKAIVTIYEPPPVGQVCFTSSYGDVTFTFTSNRTLSATYIYQVGNQIIRQGTLASAPLVGHRYITRWHETITPTPGVTDGMVDFSFGSDWQSFTGTYGVGDSTGNAPWSSWGLCAPPVIDGGPTSESWPH